MIRGRSLAMVCLGLLFAGAVMSADPEEAALLERAQLWQSRNRDDLAREFLDRLFRIAPDQPDGLLLQARLQIRANQDAEAAKTFERLRAAHPEHPAVERLAALIRIRGADQARLRQARQLARAGRIDDALKAFRELFPGVFPDDDLALEYAQLLARSRDGWERASPLLAELAQRHAYDPKYRLALAVHESQRKPVGPETLKSLRELSMDPVVSRQARVAWRNAVLGLDAIEQSLPALREYLASEPGDSAVAERLDSVAKAVEMQRKRAADPALLARREGMALLDEGKLDAAETRLREAIGLRSNDAEAIGAMGLLRLRQGRHAEAGEFFAKARDLDSAARAKWDGLVRTAGYWDLLRQARQARDSGRLELAEQQLREARSLDFREPNAAVDLARVHVLQGRVADAERLFREALDLAPDSANALEGLIELFLRGGRDREAEARMQGLAPEKRREIGRAIASIRAGRLRDQGEQLLSQGRRREAIAALEEAASIDGDDPWLRLDLARAHAAEGEPQRGQALFEELLQRRPGDGDAHFAMALFLSGVNRESQALSVLERVEAAQRTSGMTRLQRRLWVSVQGARAQALAKSGQEAKARQIVASARAAIADDHELALEVAGAYVGIGDVDAARDLLARSAAEPAQPSLEWRIGQARLLNRMDADAELRAVLDRIAALGPATLSQIDEIGDLSLSLALRQADALRAAGQPAKALKLLQDSRPQRPTPAQAARHGFAQARAMRSLRRWDDAAAMYRAILQADAAQLDAKLSLIDVLVESGNHDQARQEAAQALRTLPPDDPDASASLAASLIALGDYPGARSLVESALRTSPDHPQALACSGQLALRDGRIDEAIAFQQRSLASEMLRRQREGAGRLSRVRQPPERGGALMIDAASDAEIAAERSTGGGYRQLAELLDREGPWISSALDWRSRSGSAGKSRLSAQELPLEWKQGWSRGGRWFFRADAARVSSGVLDLADASEAATFGGVLLCQPLCNTGKHPQTEKGLGLSLGVERDRLRLDVGTSPLGFPVVNLLGGILHKGDLGPVSYSVDASRRPVASSVLSFAGAKDPNTGRVWGGVVATGVRLGFSRDSGGDHGAWSSLAWHRLSGRNVQDNDRAQVMAGAYRRLINEENRQLTVGATGMLWRFSENAGEFTFGHGGYYSPRTYRSLSLPLTYGWRGALSSFSVRASVSVAWSDASRAPFFPTDSEMQAAATAATAVNFVDPFFDGGNGGRSFGRSLSAAWERQLAPGVFVGGRIEVERSTNYEPNRFLLYLRLATDRPAARPVAFPPEAVLPGSQY